MPKKTALVVVDVQNILFETPGYELYRAKEVLGVISRLIGSAREVGVPVVFIQHTTRGAGSEFEKGSHNWRIHPAIAPQPGDSVCLKYSYDAFYDTDLHATLKELGATRLVFCGLQTEVCMDTTVRSALAHGYAGVLAADGHSTYDKPCATAQTIIDLHNDVLHRRFCTVMPSDGIKFSGLPQLQAV
ncbi:isochorismatase family protein [Pseudodesulfovibrio sp. F-1]|uniref:Isochorismatase family protein n=1 Tax=Pseudodesulfovibrio alkaliphilus TaxID=2661613 RepID=A0A7K1KPV9_9BACT|nr:cysteine hydrolase family protein [Pseudodesulfovibrio alkaliphilus]MUM78010.1 isochorismatase family protein [Pseudodesulfovibrio alkaliphilus]